MPPGFLAVDGPTATAFATRVQELIRAVDQPPACGWIVNLRQNGGGLMWPMLAGIGPLLGEGEAGATVSSNERGPPHGGGRGVLQATPHDEQPRLLALREVAQRLAEAVG